MMSKMMQMQFEATLNPRSRRRSRKRGDDASLESPRRYPLLRR